jgi:hypothetical protein
MSDNPLLARAESIVRSLVAPDTEDRVNQSVKRFAPAIREFIRSETGLKLSDGDQRGALPVRVTTGMPLSFAKVVAEEPDPVLWKLLALRARLHDAARTLDTVTELMSEIGNWSACPTDVRETLGAVPPAKHCVAVLASLQRADEAKKKIQAIISEDILGCYYYPQFHASRIELFWMPIGLIAQAINVSAENLAIVVLIHELAHGYTHIGCDIDAERWELEDFAKTDVDVKEGLAQHYTAVISEKMDGRSPGCHAAYEALLEMQSGPYVFHQDWLKDRPARRGEAVRYALLAARRSSITGNEWLTLLDKTSQSLRGESRPGPGGPRSGTLSHS